VRALLQAIWTVLLVTLVGLIVAGKASAVLIVAVALVFAVVLAYWLLTEQSAATRFPALARLPGAAPRPHLKLDPVVIQTQAVEPTRRGETSRPGGAGQSSKSTGTGIPTFAAQFVRVPVSNDYRAPVPAEDVQGWLDFKRVNGQALAAPRSQARWAHTEQPGDRSRFARLDDPALNEARIPAGSTRHLDVVAFAYEFGGFRVWTNESMLMLGDPRYRIEADDFIVTVTVRGSNTSLLAVKLRIGKGSDGVPVVELAQF